MKFDKYSAIYRNDNLTINDEEIIGKVKYVTDNELETLDRIIYDSEYFMSDDLKEEIDSILESEEE